MYQGACMLTIEVYGHIQMYMIYCLLQSSCMTAVKLYGLILQMKDQLYKLSDMFAM